MILPPPRPPPFPYTTLFRSDFSAEAAHLGQARDPWLHELAGAIGFCQKCEFRVVSGKRSEEHTSELQSPYELVCRVLLEEKTPSEADLPRYHARTFHYSHTW